MRRIIGALALLCWCALAAPGSSPSKRTLQRQEAKIWSRFDESIRDSIRVSTKHFLSQHGQVRTHLHRQLPAPARPGGRPAVLQPAGMG
jgi:hypothetical protein